MDLEHQSQLMKLLEEEFICPIYKMPIHNPVITPVGITYEKEALEEWLDINGVEPQSKNPLNKQNLVQNLALKELIGKIYKEVPKLERSLTEKDDMIANLTEEVAQLKKELEYEKQKSRENEELTDFTLEKTKKIRKIQEEAIGQKEMERMKLKQKLKEISRLRIQLNEGKVNQKILKGSIADLSNSADRLSKELVQTRTSLRQIQQMHQNLLKDCRGYQSALQQFESESYRAIKCQQRHRQYIMEYLFTSMDDIIRQYQQHGLSVQKLQAIIMCGVDGRMEEKMKVLKEECTDARRLNVIEKVCEDFKNKVLIQRYLFRRRMVDKETKSRQFHYELISVRGKVGYKIQFLPYSDPPTEQQLAIDWSKIIKLVLNQVDDRKWKILMGQIHRFPGLRELRINQCSISNLTEGSLSSMASLNSMYIQRWIGCSLEAEKEMNNFKNLYPQVSVTILWKQNSVIDT